MDGGVPQRPTADVARRLAGAALLACVLLVIVVVAAIRGRVVAGEPAAQPVEPAPQVGDCVTENPHAPDVDLFNLPALRIAPCSGSRFGEVAFVLAEFAPPTSDGDPGPDPCGDHVDDYLGTPQLPSADGSFEQFAVVGWTLVGPDPRQRAAGQKWVACAVYFPTFAGGASSVTVDHSLQGAWHRTEDSRLFAVCLDDTASVTPALCTSPHRFEVLGLAVGKPAIAQSTLESACRRIVVDALGSSAALDRGDLASQVLAIHQEPNSGGWITGPEAVSADREYSNLCLATPTDRSRRLTAAVRGLGDGTVPLN